MNWLLYVSGAGSLYGAYTFFSVAKSAVHEIEGLMCILIAVVCIAGGAVIGAIERSQETVRS
jgi:hypothetical protein